MKKPLMIYFILVLALCFMNAQSKAPKFWFADSFFIEWMNGTDYTEPMPGSDNSESKDSINSITLNNSANGGMWGDISNYFTWGLNFDIYKNNTFKMDFSFWNGVDLTYTLTQGHGQLSNLVALEPDFNNSLNFHFHDIYHFTIGIRPQFKLDVLATNENYNDVNTMLEYVHYDASIENIFKVTKAMDIHAKWYFRDTQYSVAYWDGANSVAANPAFVGKLGNNNGVDTYDLAFITAFGSPGIRTGDPYRAYMGDQFTQRGWNKGTWDPASEWHMGYRNNHGISPGYSNGLGWMFNNIVIISLNPRFARNYDTGGAPDFFPEQNSVYQGTVINTYFGICENLSKPLGIKNVDITLFAEEAVNIQMPFATGSEITKTIYTGGYYGFEIGWKGLTFDLCMVLNTRDSWNKSMPLQKDSGPDTWTSYSYNGQTVYYNNDGARGKFINPSCMAGFATRLQLKTGFFKVMGEYIGFAEIRKYDAYEDTNGSIIGTANKCWYSYIKVGSTLNF